MAKISLDSIVSGFKSVSKLIANFDKIEDDLNDKVLYRDNPTGEPNQMENNLDMNSQRIVNLVSPVNDSEPARWADVKNGVTGIDEPVPSQTGNAKTPLTTNGTGLVFGQIEADHVDFTNSGTGGVERTLQAKLEDVVTLEDFGGSPTASGVTNASAFIQAVATGSLRLGSSSAYEFDFEGQSITYTKETLSIDLGTFLHTFKNFGGLSSTSLTDFKWNGRLDADNTSITSLVYSTALERIVIDTVEVNNIFNTSAEVADEVFLFRWQDSSEREFNLTCGNAIFNNLVTKSDARPMSIFGNFGSSSTLSTIHQLHFDNFEVNNFYAVDTDEVTIIDGETDVLRLFNTPVHININNLKLNNVAKRFIKTQERCMLNVNNCYTSLDSRFEASVNHIGTFESQAVNQVTPSEFHFNSLEADYSAATGSPILYNASGDDHEFTVDHLRYNNIDIYSGSQDIKIHINDARGEGLNINAVNSTQVVIKGLKDTDMGLIKASKVIIEDFEISSSLDLSSGQLISPSSAWQADLRNGKFIGFGSDSRIAYVNSITNVTYEVTGTTGAAQRPFSCSYGVEKVHITNLEVKNTSSDSLIALYNSGGSAKVVIRDYYGSDQLAFLNGGTYDVVLDNCENTTVTGVGVNSLVTATYS